jgi:hypothetical protein
LITPTNDELPQHSREVRIDDRVVTVKGDEIPIWAYPESGTGDGMDRVSWSPGGHLFIPDPENNILIVPGYPVP